MRVRVKDIKGGEGDERKLINKKEEDEWDEES